MSAPEYFFDPSERTVLVKPIPKCGYQSIAACLTAVRDVSRWSLPIITFVRDPLERLASAFRFFLQTYRSWASCPTYESFVDLTLLENDPHWLPQSDWLADGPYPTMIYPFEQLAQRWAELQLPTLPHKNATMPMAVDSSYRVDELRARYARDYELRAQWH